jgi:Zinc finger, C2H2 type
VLPTGVCISPTVNRTLWNSDDNVQYDDDIRNSWTEIACYYCSEQFVSEDLLAAHLKTHHVCVSCGFTTSHRSTLWMHMRTHANDVTCPSREHSERYKTSSNLNHIVTTADDSVHRHSNNDTKSLAVGGCGIDTVPQSFRPNDSLTHSTASYASARTADYYPSGEGMPGNLTFLTRFQLIWLKG